MDAITASQTIQALITQKQSELDSLNLALSVLNSTFAPDMTAIKDAQADADVQRTKVAAIQDSLDTVNANLATEQTAHLTDNTTNQATITDLQASLDTANATLVAIDPAVVSAATASLQPVPAQPTPAEEIKP